MSLSTLTDWSIVIFAGVWLGLVFGYGLARLLILAARVGELEAWADEVGDELVAREDRDDRAGKAVA